jgi:hypothetical protein
MDRNDYLQLMRLLSVMEALVVAHKVHMPDYVYDWLSEAALKLEKEILSESGYGRVPDSQRF